MFKIQNLLDGYCLQLCKYTGGKSFGSAKQAMIISSETEQAAEEPRQEGRSRSHDRNISTLTGAGAWLPVPMHPLTPTSTPASFIRSILPWVARDAVAFQECGRQH